MIAAKPAGAAGKNVAFEATIRSSKIPIATVKPEIEKPERFPLRLPSKF
jgi:hypothetical protein